MPDFVDRFDGALTSTAIKTPVRVATTANIILSGLQTVDGVVLVADDRVLVKDQTEETENGIYTAASTAWSRAPDFDGNRDIVKGTLVRVVAGTLYADSYWVVTADNPIVIDTDDITFAQSNSQLAGVSAFMQTVLDDANASTARATLGAYASTGGTITGNVSIDGLMGIGILTTPRARLDIQQSSTGGTPNGNSTLILERNNANVLQMLSPDNNSCSVYFGDATSASVGRITYNHSDDSQAFWVNGAEAARISSTGAFMVGRTNSSSAANDSGVIVAGSGVIVTALDGTSAQSHIVIVNNAAVSAATVGSISSNGSATAFNTSSDERLKEGLTEFDSGDIIDRINIGRFTWKLDGTNGYGVYAQQAYEVFPEAVTPGDTELSPGDEGFVPWTVDYSKLVPLLMMEIKHLRRRVEKLENVL